MTKEEAKEKLHEIHVKWNRIDLTREEYKAIDEEWWKLATELYESKNHELHMLGYFEFTTDTAFSYCDDCTRKDECPKRESLEEGEIVTDCNMHSYWED